MVIVKIKKINLVIPNINIIDLVIINLIDLVIVNININNTIFSINKINLVKGKDNQFGYN